MSSISRPSKAMGSISQKLNIPWFFGHHVDLPSIAPQDHHSMAPKTTCHKKELGEAQLNIRICVQCFGGGSDLMSASSAQTGPRGSAGQYQVCARKLLRRRAGYDIHLRCPTKALGKRASIFGSSAHGFEEACRCGPQVPRASGKRNSISGSAPHGF